ncbi:MAG: methylenetetrahydrofolate reductase [NAD(P)H] [Bacteroidales bacterium]|nr:methylenetetrahydrofolate reductase [NAD(P)H] [Bacteroidales bacterium]
MKISEILRSSTKTYPSLEIVPPLKGIGKDELLESIRPLMEFEPKYINVTCHRDEVEFVANPDGTYTKKTVQNRVSEVVVATAIQQHYGVDAVPHMICAGATKEHIHAELENLRYLGIENVLALRGDCLVGEKRFTPTPGGYHYASELVSGIREQNPDFCIGVGAYPEKHFESPNLETDIQMLKKKVDAGADYIITQMFFDNQVFYDFVAKCREAGITVPIIPGIKPLSTVRQLTMLPEAFSIDIPLRLSEMVAKAADKEEAYRIGTDWCIAQCKDLIAHNVPAIHLYTMTKSRNIVEILRACF